MEITVDWGRQSRPDLRVWMREIRQHDTPATFGAQPNPPLERVRLIAPAAVAAQSVDIFIADTAQKKIFKYDRATQTITTFADVPDMGNVVQLHVDRGLSVYLVDQFSAKTTQYYNNKKHLSRWKMRRQR